MGDCNCSVEINDASQKKILYWLMAINGVMFVTECSVGWLAESTALLADSFDMLADAVVYGIGLFAVGKALHVKANAALASSYFQACLGVLLLIDIARRTLLGSAPVSPLMITMGTLALIANIICLMLIQKHKDGEVHMRASWIFSTNDVIANFGIILSGLLVGLLNNRWPDIFIGILISLIILRGARLIYTDAKGELNALQ